MDNVKKFEDFLDRMQGLLDNAKKQGHIIVRVEDLENAFPELKESEDRKMIRIIEDAICTNEAQQLVKTKYGLELTDLADWLEKQGEQKSVKFDDTNTKRMFIKALERVEEQNNKGYKLTDCDKNSWWEDFKTYTSCTVEQNPAWSEEDEYLLVETIQHLEELIRIDTTKHCGCDVQYYQRDIDWLKYLKDRVGCEVNCTTTNEWSENEKLQRLKEKYEKG